MKRPVTVVTGFLGTGKTTFLRAVLSHSSTDNTAVLVNEFGKVGLDHQLLRQVDENIQLLGGGCLCCAKREDLVNALMDLLDMDESGKIAKLERVIIETSGLADPAPIIFTILQDPVLQHHFYVECVIVTVDVVNGHLHLDHQPESVKQVVAADKIILTKTDIASAEAVKNLAVRLHSLNPTAEVLEAINGKVDVHSVFKINNNLKNLQIQMDKIDSHSHHLPNTRSISLTFDKPLDWTAFGLWLSMLLQARGQDVLRVKGLIDVGDAGPVVLNGVQHIIHPPEHLDSWPNDDHRSHVVFIMRSIDPADVFHSLQAFQQYIRCKSRPTRDN